MSSNHWMLFGTFAEQDFFEYPQKGTYQGVIINANMAAHAPNGLGAFLLKKTSAQTRYLIDPLTHAFQHEPGVIVNPEGVAKSSLLKLAKAYGEPVSEYVGRKPVLPIDFSDKGELEDFVIRCMEFQRNQLAKAMLNSDVAKYLQNSIKDEIRPYALIAPYFFMSETSFKQWLPINADAARITVENSLDREKCFASIVVGRGLLVEEEARKAIATTYEGIPLSGYLIWVDNLDEQNATKAELLGLLDLGTRLHKNHTRELINLHGGYFSVLSTGSLGRHTFSGVAHAPEFGEYRPVVPVGGGIPISRYYVPDLHVRMRFRDALRMFSSKGWLQSVEEFHSQVCDCEECVDTLDRDIQNFLRFGESNPKMMRRGHGIVRIDFPTRDARKRCLRHYLQRKRREYISAIEAPKQELAKNLIDGAEKYRDIAGLEGVEHLELWSSVLAEHESLA